MFISRLELKDNLALIKNATLLALSESPALWDGKRLDELTSADMHSSLDVSEDGVIFEALEKMRSECRTGYPGYFFAERLDGVYEFNQALRDIPLHKVESSECRLSISKGLQSSIFESDGGGGDKVFTSPSDAKLAVFELLLLASSEGGISEVKMSLIRSFASQYAVEDFIVDDLVNEVKDFNNQVSKALSLILE